MTDTEIRQGQKAAATDPYIFDVAGMDCGDCAKSVERVVSKLPNVDSASVSFASGTLTVSPTTLGFSGSQGGSNPAARTLSLSSSGTGTLSWSAATSQPWLSITPTSGAVPVRSIGGVSQDESGLKLNVHQDLAAGQFYTLVIDFDASLSVVDEGNGSYRLKPVLTAQFL